MCMKLTWIFMASGVFLGVFPIHTSVCMSDHFHDLILLYTAEC